jgi:hypothetical protein
MPNPSLEPTRYGRQCKPGLSHSYYRLSPGLQYLPTRAAQLERQAAQEPLIKSTDPSDRR